MHIEYEGKFLGVIQSYSQYSVETSDTLFEIEEGIFQWKRVFQPTRDYIKIPVSNLRMDLGLTFNASYKMIPGVSYDGNKWGDGKEPQGFSYDNAPYSFAYHRTSVAGGMYAQDNEYGVGMFADMKGLEECGLSCSIDDRNQCTVLSILLPEQEMPVTFANKGVLIPGYSHTVYLSKEQPLECNVYICISKLAEAKAGYAQFLDCAWKRNNHTVKPWFEIALSIPETSASGLEAFVGKTLQTLESQGSGISQTRSKADGRKIELVQSHECQLYNHKIWELSTRFAKEYLWSDENGLFGFSIGLRPEEKGFEKVPGNRYEAGWCGQNISYGVSLLHDYLLHGNTESLDKGVACLDTWCKAKLDNGLSLVHLQDLRVDDPERYKRPIDSCNLGAMVENFLDAYEIASECGVNRPEYKDMALSICDFAIQKQSSDGHYPAAFNHLGEVTQPDGSTGGFLVPAMLWAYAITEDTKYLVSAKSAFQFYFSSLVENGYTTAGALDTYCIDKESAIPLLSAALMLYHIDADINYLRAAKLTAYYLSTWQWHHSVSFPVGTILHDYNYETFGGTSVSTQHHHIDPYALRYVPYLLRLSELTESEIWKERAVAAWGNATYGISDGSMVVAGLLRPVGSQDEGYYHTRWALPFSVSQWLVAWPAAFRLEVLRKTDFFSKSPLYPDGIRI